MLAQGCDPAVPCTGCPAVSLACAGHCRSQRVGALQFSDYSLSRPEHEALERNAAPVRDLGDFKSACVATLQAPGLIYSINIHRWQASFDFVFCCYAGGVVQNLAP